VVRVETSGGGGYGHAERRAPEAVAADLLDGRLAAADARGALQCSAPAPSEPPIPDTKVRIRFGSPARAPTKGSRLL
jgi:hypothetical protein